MFILPLIKRAGQQGCNLKFEDPNMVDRGSSSAMEDCCDRSNNLPRMRENIMRVLMQTLRDADHNAHSHETTGGQCNFYTIKGACGLQC